MERKRLLPLFLTFLKIGAFTFGGGYAMIPMIRREIVEKHGWMTEKDILDILAISESTPGPIAVNAATFVGYQSAGICGALFATIGVILPAFVVMYVISFFLTQFEHLKLVKYAFIGVRSGVLALILNAFFTMGKQCPKNIFSYLVAAAVFVAVAVFQWNVILVLLVCALAGAATVPVLRKMGKGR